MIVHPRNTTTLRGCSSGRWPSFFAPVLLLWLVAAAAASGAGCGRRDGEAARKPSGRTEVRGAAPTAAPTPAAAETASRPPAAAQSSRSSADDTAANARTASPDASAPQPLSVEEREHDPAAREVTIKVIVEPPRKAQVWWGARNLGIAPVELKRPRGSGPVDLIVRTPGYLTFHTRAFTDRDDKIVVRLVAEADAARMHGFRAQ